MEEGVISTETATGDVAVQLRGITKTFPGVRANYDIDITVRRGTVHAIVGENGAGKSTLMKTLYGMHKPDEGTIEIDGQAVTLKSPSDAIARGVGMVHQHFQLADNFTVLENVILGDEPAGRSGVIKMGEARDRIEEIGRAYRLSVDPDALVEDIGVGDRQRVEIIKVLYRGCRTLILDEPTAVLVPQEVEQLFSALAELKSQGLTVIFISHKLDEVLSVADEITVIRGGTTVTTVLPSEVTARQLAELMVGSELPSPETRESTVTDRTVLEVAGVSLANDAGRRRARRHLAHDPRGRGARHRRASRATARPSSSRRHGPAEAATPAPWSSAARTSPRGAPGRVARRASATSPRTARGTACCSRRPCGRTASSATRPRRRTPRACSSTARARVPTPSASWRSTTSARPASTSSPRRCPAATSRS